jgi:crotonobetainyl-CoA:carnitine CoA-transferase CaiB-like acyl-CoA transferase
MTAVEPRAALEHTWDALGGAPGALDDVQLVGEDPVLPSSYPIGTMAAAAVGVAAVAAAQVWQVRTGEQQAVRIDVDQVMTAFRSEQFLRVDGARAGDVWNAFSGFYRTGDDEFVQLHTNFAHHLRRTLGELGVAADRDAVRDAVRVRGAQELEDALAAAGACASFARTRQEWLAHPQGHVVGALPLLDTVTLGAGPPRPLAHAERPLADVRVLDLTRVIAGPIATRTLAAHGADVLRVSSAGLPEIDALLPDTSIGKRSTFLNLRDTHDADRFRALLERADIVVQSYRPGALDALGFGPQQVAELRPDIVYVSLSAYSHAGPWRGRRGYDTLVQTASGVARAEAAAFGVEQPKHVPIAGLDHATGYFAATAAMKALVDRHLLGGSRHVRCSLAQTREWLETLGRIEGTTTPWPDDATTLETLPVMETPNGRVTYAPPGGELTRTPARYAHGPVTPGSDPPAWW